MANQGENKRKDENDRHMAKLRLIMIVCNVLYIIVRLLISHLGFTWKHWFGLVVTSLGYAIPYKLLAQMAKSSVTSGGEHIDGGIDMRNGLCGYLHDVFYITCFVQLGSIISAKFWYTYLLIPAFGAYRASDLIRGFRSHGSERGVEDNKTREEMEREASGGQVVKTRSQ